MSPGNEERPTGESGASEAQQAGRPFAYVSNPPTEFDLVAISAGSDKPRYETLLFGWSTGYESRQPEVDRLRWQRDLWYFCYTNGKKPGDFYAHLTNKLWIEATQ